MEFSFSGLCFDDGLREALRRYIDLCAEKGQSYEFPRCRMPEGCCPAHADLGFFRRETGCYVMYWRPAVIYQGHSSVLRLLFQQCLWSFDSYPLLSARLRSLRPELPPPCPKQRPTHFPWEPGGAQTGLPRRRTGEGQWPPLYPMLRDAIGERVRGQQEAVDAAAYYLSGHITKCAPARPLSLILHGPTGVGKSELGKTVAPVLERLGHGGWQFVWTELNTFTQSHSIHRLTGAPPGYVGYEDEPVFAAVRRNPRTIFMFDELDKAHPDVLKIFMSVLDEGRCSVSRAAQDGGRELDFRKCVFLFTSNLDLTRAAQRRPGFSAVQESAPFCPYSTAAATPDELAQRLFLQNEWGRKALIHHGVLREIAGRFTGFIGFCPLNAAARLQIAAQKAIALGAEYGLRVSRVTPEAAQALLPEEDATSIRAILCLLDAKLSPLYQRYTAGRSSAACQLTLDSGVLTLSADDCAAAV